MRMNKVGNFSAEAIASKQKEAEKEEEEKKRSLTFKVGERCETSVAKQPKRRGVVMFKGIENF